MITPIAISDGNFDADGLQSGQPMRVDFWAEWRRSRESIGPISWKFPLKTPGDWLSPGWARRPIHTG
ncbi:MAG: hypothetical protein IIC78_12440 [Chloroflexi bacterium]|nr:hypothetical protein [Chloroflexota bacterium]